MLHEDGLLIFVERNESNWLQIFAVLFTACKENDTQNTFQTQ